MLEESEQPTTWSRRLLPALPIAAVVIVAVCWWKLNQEPPDRTGLSLPKDLRPAPAFALPDQQSKLVRLDTFMHYHYPILIVFYDGRSGPAANPWLKALEAYNPPNKDLVVLGVSLALPQENRAADFGFPLLTDLNPAEPDSLAKVHRQWGVVDNSGQTVPSVFYINRSGQVEWSGPHPKPLEQPGVVLKAVLQGRDLESVL